MTPILVQNRDRLWLGASLAFALLCAILGLAEGFRGEYIVQDDARQHVFWMLRFLDPQLFPNDLIADYFQSVAPSGYTQLYRVFAMIGISPLLLNKLLPIVLGLISTFYAFRLSMLLFPVPFAAGLSSIILNMALWMKDDLVSATPRAFVYPFFIAFLYYLTRRSLLPCLATIALTGLFYPQYVLVESGILILQLVNFPQFKLDRNTAIFCLAGLGVAFFILLPYAIATSEYGPVISYKEAINSPEFWDEGRNPFFDEDPIDSWVFGRRSGFIPLRTPDILWLGLLFPVLLPFNRTFPLRDRLSKPSTLLLQIPVVGFGLFFAARALLFKLHLPSRYPSHSLRILLSLMAGMAIVAILETGWQWVKVHRLWKLPGIAIIAVLVMQLIVAPVTSENFPKTVYEEGKAVELYQFFRQQPKDIRIASLNDEGDFIPTFARRSVLVAREYAIPYHMGYYRQIRTRLSDLMQAQYSDNLAVAGDFIEQYGIDFWLIDKQAFQPDYMDKNNWLQGFYKSPIQTDPLVNLTQATHDRLMQGIQPAIIATIPTCQVFESDRSIVVNAKCVLDIRDSENQ